MIPGFGAGRVLPRLGLSMPGGVTPPGRGAGRVIAGGAGVGRVNDGLEAGGRTIGLPYEGTVGFVAKLGRVVGRLGFGMAAPPRDGRDPPRVG